MECMSVLASCLNSTSSICFPMQAWLPGRAPVRAAIKARHAVDDSGRIILLEAFCPWKDHLYELEAELGVSPPILYCLYEVCPVSCI